MVFFIIIVVVLVVILLLLLFPIDIHKPCRSLMCCIYFVGCSSFGAGKALGSVKQSTFMYCIHKS